jgi:hypothetical protein
VVKQGHSDSDDFASALWYLDAMRAIGVETGSWPSDDDTRMPNNPKYPREGLGER